MGFIIFIVFGLGSFPLRTSQPVPSVTLIFSYVVLSAFTYRSGGSKKHKKSGGIFLLLPLRHRGIVLFLACIKSHQSPGEVGLGRPGGGGKGIYTRMTSEVRSSEEAHEKPWEDFAFVALSGVGVHLPIAGVV